MLYDTHAHLDMVNDLDSVISNAKESGVKIIVSQSVNIESMKKTYEIYKAHSDIVKFSPGLYPEDFLKAEDYDELEAFVIAHKDDVFAIGEIGMDFSREGPDKKVQEEVFRKQLKLAEKLNIPVSIHTRKAEKEIIETLKEFPNVKKILHCFSGKFKLVKEAEELGCYFSIPTNIVRSEHFQKMAREISRDKILTETDTPYLSPFKDEWNEPANIKETVKVLSEIWNVSADEVEKIIEDNFNGLY